jgi:hypothetical protein
MKKLLGFLFFVLFLAACDGSLSDSGDSSTGTGGSMSRFACIGTHLYVVDADYLQTFDVSDSSQIVRTSRISTGWSSDIETIFPADSLLFLGSTSGMYIFNIKTPSAPAYVYCYTHVVSCDPVVVQGKYAYVTMRSDFDSWSCSNGSNQLEVIDISDINQPQSKGLYPMTNPRGLAIDGGLLFVCDGMDIAVFDASNPLSLTELKRIELDATPLDVIAKNGKLIVSYAAGLKQYAYTNETIEEISSIY